MDNEMFHEVEINGVTYRLSDYHPTSDLIGPESINLTHPRRSYAWLGGPYSEAFDRQLLSFKGAKNITRWNDGIWICGTWTFVQTRPGARDPSQDDLSRRDDGFHMPGRYYRMKSAVLSLVWALTRTDHLDRVLSNAYDATARAAMYRRIGSKNPDKSLTGIKISRQDLRRKLLQVFDYSNFDSGFGTMYFIVIGAFSKAPDSDKSLTTGYARINQDMKITRVHDRSFHGGSVPGRPMISIKHVLLTLNINTWWVDIADDDAKLGATIFHELLLALQDAVEMEINDRPQDWESQPPHSLTVYDYRRQSPLAPQETHQYPEELIKPLNDQDEELLMAWASRFVEKPTISHDGV